MKISLILFINVESSLFVGANVCGFQCNPCPQIYIPTNALTSICLIFIKFRPFYRLNYAPRTKKTLATHEQWSPQIKILPLYFAFKMSTNVMKIHVRTEVGVLTMTDLSPVHVTLGGQGSCVRTVSRCLRSDDTFLEHLFVSSREKSSNKNKPDINQNFQKW